MPLSEDVLSMAVDPVDELASLIAPELVAEVERLKGLATGVVEDCEWASRQGFRDVGMEDLQLILDINRFGLAPSSLGRTEAVVIEHLRVNEEMKRRWGVSSFLVCGEQGVPVGCAMVRVRGSLKNPAEPVLRLHSMVALPQAQGQVFGGGMFLKVLDMASKIGLPVEIMCRESTSFKAFKKRHGAVFQGFKVTVDMDIRFERDGESYYYVRLDRNV